MKDVRRWVLRMFKRHHFQSPKHDGSILSDVWQPGLHEQQLTDYFGPENLRYEAEGACFDRPLMILAFTNRSGSNLLGEYLRQTGQVSGVGEFLNHTFVRQKSESLKLSRFPDHIRYLESTANSRQILGIKASHDQLAMLLRWRIHHMFPAVKILNIQRRDRLGQAVSLLIADQSKQWTSFQKPIDTQPQFDAHRLDQILKMQQHADLLTQLLAESADIPLHHVTYENLCADPASVVRATLEFCGAPQPDWQPQSPRLEKQASALNEAFRSKYLDRLQRKLY